MDRLTRTYVLCRYLPNSYVGATSRDKLSVKVRRLCVVHITCVRETYKDLLHWIRLDSVAWIRAIPTPYVGNRNLLTNIINVRLRWFICFSRLNCWTDFDDFWYKEGGKDGERSRLKS